MDHVLVLRSPCSSTGAAAPALPRQNHQGRRNCTWRTRFPLTPMAAARHSSVAHTEHTSCSLETDTAAADGSAERTKGTNWCCAKTTRDETAPQSPSSTGTNTPPYLRVLCAFIIRQHGCRGEREGGVRAGAAARLRAGPAAAISPHSPTATRHTAAGSNPEGHHPLQGDPAGPGGGPTRTPRTALGGGLRIAAAALQEGAFSAPFPSARAVNARSDSAVTHRRLRCRPRFPTERKRRCSRTGRRAAAAVPHRAREAPLRSAPPHRHRAAGGPGTARR